MFASLLHAPLPTRCTSNLSLSSVCPRSPSLSLGTRETLVLTALTDHHLNLRTTPQILKRTTKTFFFNLFTFLCLSLLFLTFRTIVESGAPVATAYIDRDSSLKSILAKLDISDTRVRSPETTASLRRRHRRLPFLQLTRVGTLDDDFFSGDDNDDRILFSPRGKTKINGSYVKFSHFDRRLGFSEFVEDNGVRV